LILSFSILGTFAAYAAASLDLDPHIYRTVAAAVLGSIGIVLLSASPQRRYASAASGVGIGVKPCSRSWNPRDFAANSLSA